MSTAVCHTCPRHCALDEGQTGACHARANLGGEVRCTNYGRLTSLALDPVEKKPFSCWHPGSSLLSVGSYGCNLSCPFCQNASISQEGESGISWREVSPQELVVQACGLSDYNCIGLAYTYNEPLIGWEFVRDCSVLSHEKELLNAVVSNGAIEPALFQELLPLIDAVNFDLKAFNDNFYAACGLKGALECVKANIEAASASSHCHVEVTTLFVPGMSSQEDVLAAGKWLAELDSRIPYHISQYHPAYKMRERPVPDEELYAIIAKLQTMLETVIPGNMF